MENREQIEIYLRDLDEEIGKQKPLAGTVVECWVSGGGAILAHGMQYRKSTKDLDAVITGIDTVYKSPEADALKKAVRKVAAKHQLAREWFNGDAALFVRDMMPKPELIPWYAGQHLQVSIPSVRCLLVMKLMSGRPKDSEDIDVLLDEVGIETREQAQALVDEFVPDRRYQIQDRLPKTLTTLFG